ncbi:hypothetical protein BDN72DRAFT_958112 [Pluteus cervinus]|uniref:Uncharacterized protein n=1 Tax=Pluteus cervinus TaxID=181527 RepID=A0ACD3B0X7_9AGAR|nr:hypothetical protein BDN72DRAFT_958112 [Pluteus cervinus]
MDIPEIHELEEAAKEIVRAAGARGELETLTPRIIRAKLEKHFSLDDGSLGDEPYRSAIKDALKEAVDEVMAEEQPPSSPLRKEKKPVNQPKAKGTKAKQKDKVKEKESPEKKPPAKRKQVNKEPEASSSEKAKGKRKDFKSAEEIVDSSDEGENESPSTSKRKKTPQEPKPKRRKVEANTDDEVEVTEAKPSKVPAASPKKAKSPPKLSSPVKPAKQDKEEEALKSESELSVLIDEPPKPKRKTTKDSSKTKKNTSQGKSRSSNPAPALTKDEETIKRLKSFVLACGVRKVWAKVFQGMDQPSQQIKKLKEILADLGMTSRMSLEQAKAIRAKRELAQELEDVQSFEKATRRQGRHSESKSASEEEEEESEDDGKPVKRKTAHQSIMAFLGDQDDSD